MAANTGQSNSAAGEITSLKVLGARLTRLFLGPAALALVLWHIAASGGWSAVPAVAFFVILGLTILARWVEQRSGAATTLTGQPATLEQCKRFTFVLLAVGVIAWLGASLIGTSTGG